MQWLKQNGFLFNTHAAVCRSVPLRQINLFHELIQGRTTHASLLLVSPLESTQALSSSECVQDWVVSS